MMEMLHTGYERNCSHALNNHADGPVLALSNARSQGRKAHGNCRCAMPVKVHSLYVPQGGHDKQLFYHVGNLLYMRWDTNTNQNPEKSSQL